MISVMHGGIEDHCIPAASVGFKTLYLKPTVLTEAVIAYTSVVALYHYNPAVLSARWVSCSRA
jgi:hypothetical protein